MWNLNKQINKQQQQNKLTDRDNSLIVAGVELEVGGRWANLVKGVKRYKLPAIK